MAAEGYSLSDGGERTRINIGGRLLRPCGTWAALQRHKKRGEEPCAACHEAGIRWKRYEAARKLFERRRAEGATHSVLGRLIEIKLKLELEYRSLELRTETPQPPSRRWKVYRFNFENGQQ